MHQLLHTNSYLDIGTLMQEMGILVFARGDHDGLSRVHRNENVPC